MYLFFEMDRSVINTQHNLSKPTENSLKDCDRDVMYTLLV